MAFITCVAREVCDAVINAGAYLNGHEALVDGSTFTPQTSNLKPQTSNLTPHSSLLTNSGIRLSRRADFLRRHLSWRQSACC
jgi:hypothetical protein